MRFAMIIAAATLVFMSGCTKSPEQRRAEAEAAWIRGNAAIDAGNFESAISEYDQAVRADDQYALGYLARGNAKIGVQDYSAARADMDAAIAIDQTLSDAYLSRGTLAWLTGDLPAATSDFYALTQLQPSDSFYAGRYAAVLYEQQDVQTVETFYRQAYEADPSRDWALLNWLLAINETQGAEAMRLRAYSLYYDGGDQRMAVRYALGEAYFNQREYFSAIQWLSTILYDDVTSTPPDAISHLAGAYVATGQPVECERVWRQYLRRIGREAQFDPSQCAGISP